MLNLTELSPIDGHQPALICGDDVLDYAQLHDAIPRLASWMLGLGMQKGDRIAVHGGNAVSTALASLAALRAQLVLVPLFPRLTAEELTFLLQDSGAAACFTQPELRSTAEEARRHVPMLRVLVGELPQPATIAAGDMPAVDPEAIAFIVYTSGTSATPKGVVHSHRTAAESTFKGCASWELTHRDRMLVMTPITHITGLSQLLAGIHTSATVVLLPGFDAGAALDAIERHGVTVTIGVPMMIRLLIAEQRRHPRDVSSLRVCFVAGDAAPLDLHDQFRSTFRLPLVEGYGMTESVPICVNPLRAFRPGSLGIAAIGVDILISPAEGVPNADVGEILVRSSASFVEYWGDPKATADVYRDGWLRTGDLGHRDADGYFWFDGRLKELIVRGPAKISPLEVEGALLQHPAVREAAVVGLPDPLFGEVVAAAVVVRDGHSVDAPELADFLGRKLAPYKIPTRIEFRSDLPKGTTGKVQRRAVREILAGQSGFG